VFDVNSYDPLKIKKLQSDYLKDKDEKDNGDNFLESTLKVQLSNCIFYLHGMISQLHRKRENGLCELECMQDFLNLLVDKMILSS